ncbi:MAG: signal peptide peptidase SppA [Rickettsiales bacterium]|nr:signal peptide peptidase SppA [Rickettsiales bacterium]|tara:strand:+ start:818 stop:2854 length:2037 start_codon:yes stop_codon:yes gene_type:complete
MNRNRLLVLLIVLFLVAVVATAAIGVNLMVKAASGDVEEGSTLVLDLAGPFPEQPAPEAPLAGLGSQPLSVFEVDTVLEEASFDDNIEQLLIRIGGIEAGYGKVFELREIIARFSRESGKATTCWMEAGGNREYLLATACDEIFMAPEGFMLVNGLHINTTFFKGTLDKLGIEAEFTRAGRYKSAVEPLTRKEMSGPYKEMLNSIADSLFTDYVDAVASARDLDGDSVRALIDNPSITATSAHQVGLIDGLLYRDQLHDYLRGDFEPEAVEEPTEPLIFAAADTDLPTLNESAAAPGTWVAGRGEVAPELVDLLRQQQPVDAQSKGNDDDSGDLAPGNQEGRDDDDSSDQDTDDEEDQSNGPRIKFRDYQASMEDLFDLGGNEAIAVIFCEGQIMSGASERGGLSGPTMGSATLGRAIRSARIDDEIKALVLRIDSPGGSGLASDVIWREIELARTENNKPVIVSMGNLAASGGYYIAMGADVIVAAPTTLTGSIGVYGGKYNLSGLYEKLGMSHDELKRGELADLFASTKPLGEAGQAKLAEFVDAFYETFLRKAAAGRNTDPLKIHEVAQGRVWTGRQAQQIGLVDELGSLRTAIAIARERANLDRSAKLRVLPEQPSFLDELLGGSFEAHATQRLLHSIDAQYGSSTALSRLLQAAPLFASGRPVLMAPYTINIH